MSEKVNTPEGAKVEETPNQPKQPVSAPTPQAVDLSQFVPKDEVARRIEKARSEERLKVRDQIAGFESRIAEQDATIVALRKTVEQAGSESKVDIDKIIDAAANTSKQLAKQEYNQQLADMQAQLSQLQAELNAEKSDKLRSRLVEQYGGEESMVVEMVTGETEAEILAQIKYATEVKARILQKYGKTPNLPNTIDASPEGSSEGTPAPTPQVSNTVAPTPSNVVPTMPSVQQPIARPTPNPVVRNYANQDPQTRLTRKAAAEAEAAALFAGQAPV